jgi:hypothetical protein
MVLNPHTGLVSPQFHVVFDDHFKTLKYLRSNTAPPFWTDLCNSITEIAPNEFTLTRPDISSASSTSSASGGDDSNLGSTEGAATLKNGGDTSTEPCESISYTSDFLDFDTAGLRRSGRDRKITEAAQSSSINFKKLLGVFIGVFTTLGTVYQSPFPSRMCLYTATMERSLTTSRLMDNTFNHFPLFAFAAQAEQNEVYTFKEAMKQDDAKDFIQAMTKEIDDHESRNHWTMMLRSDMPVNAKTILSIWSFKRKRHPDGRLNKHKARICAHGGMQQWGIDYWETYSPVVNWISVRALLAISAIHGLPTTSIDFVLAFPQADLDTDVFMEIPIGFSRDLRQTHVLKLNKSLYGLKQASSNWYKHLTSSLSKRNFSQSKNDRCVFFKKGIIVLVYVDDCIIIGKSQSDIKSFVDSLRSGNENFDFTEEGSLEQYLGVDTNRTETNFFEMRQPFLIDKILKIISNDASNPRKVPALKDPLNKDDQGPERK